MNETGSRGGRRDAGGIVCQKGGKAFNAVMTLDHLKGVRKVRGDFWCRKRTVERRSLCAQALSMYA